MWGDLTDPLPHKLSALLAVNGVKVGVRGGTMPAELTRLSSAELSISPTARRGPADAPRTLPVNGPLDRAKFAATLALTDDPKPLSLTAAECGLTLTGTPRPDGTVTVRCQWAVQHGESRPRWTPTAAGGFDRTEARTAEAFPTLDFEVTLAPDEVLVIGPTDKADGTLGATFFLTPDGTKQRAAVIRAAGQ